MVSCLINDVWTRHITASNWGPSKSSSSIMAQGGTEARSLSMQQTERWMMGMHCFPVYMSATYIADLHYTQHFTCFDKPLSTGCSWVAFLFSITHNMTVCYSSESNITSCEFISNVVCCVNLFAE
jgi:hypothetical protein